MSSPVVDVGVSRRPSLFVKLLVGILASVALFAVYNTLSADESDEIVLQQTMPLPPRNSQSPLGTAGNKIDDGDQDAAEYDYDPLHGDDPDDPADSQPDMEGEAPPTPKWHACRFQAKQGGVYDLRPLMRLARTLEEDWVHRDAVHRDTTYYLNVCANTMAVPPQCKKLAKHDKSPAFQVGDNGNCYYLGTLKTFKWKPIDTENPSKGMVLFYANGERCSNGRARQIKYTFACSEYFTYSDGPMVVYETANGCHYDVHWPNRAGCPSLPLIQRIQSASVHSSAGGGLSAGGIFMMVVCLALAIYVCGGCWYRRTQEGATGIEACPHHTFWCALPAIVMGGGSSLFGDKGGRPSTRGFERVPTDANYGGASSGYGGTGGGGNAGGYGGVSSGYGSNTMSRDDMF